MGEENNFVFIVFNFFPGNMQEIISRDILLLMLVR